LYFGLGDLGRLGRQRSESLSRVSKRLLHFFERSGVAIGLSQ
jgi:hypothetical protein